MNSRYMLGLLENGPGAIYVFVTAYIPMGSMTGGPGTIYVFVTAYIPVGSMTVGPDTGRFQSQSTVGHLCTLLIRCMMQNDMMEEAKPGDAAWVRDIYQEIVRIQKLFSNELVENGLHIDVLLVPLCYLLP